MVHVKKFAFNGDVNIGLFAFANENFALVPDESFDVSTLNVEKIVSSVADTLLLGLFVAGNSTGILLPKIVEKREVNEIKQKLRELGFDANVEVLKAKHTALGNLIVCNDKGAVISENLKSSQNKIRDVLGVEVVVASIAESKLPGSYCVATNKGFLLSNNGSEDDYNLLKDVLKVDGDIGSVNFGSAFVKSGLLANTKGYVVGELTTGVEIARIDEALGFIDNL